MRVLVVGAGGREHAIALNCRTAGHEVLMVPDVTGIDGRLSEVDLVIPGPEAALVAGIASTCAAAGVPCFGPTAELARLESSKAHARDVTTRLGIPGPRWSRFDAGQVHEALDWWRSLGSPVVVKQDGLAAGKGVVVPTDDTSTAEAITALAARGAFLLEERMSGPECSLLALCDGTTAVALPLAQDHKRIGEGDRGPNTGGMGAYAPAPIDIDVDHLVATFITPVLDDLRATGTPYIGVLYAGLMITASGP
ncbi:MAG: phosphoribosylamine--glycine ligase, partial [Ilumatobacteraceae bacterium]